MASTRVRKANWPNAERCKMNENDGERSSTTATFVVVATLPDHQPPTRITFEESSAARMRGGSFGAATTAFGHGVTAPIVTPCAELTSCDDSHAAKSASSGAIKKANTRTELRRF